MWIVPSRWEAQTQEHHGERLKMKVDCLLIKFPSRPTLDKRAETKNATVKEDHVVLLAGRHTALLAAPLFLEFPLPAPRQLGSHPASQLSQKVSQSILGHEAW